MKKKLNWRTAALAACVLVFLVSGSLLVRDLIRSSRERAANEQLAAMVRAARGGEAEPAPSGTGTGIQSGLESVVLPKYAASGLLYQYDALYSMNSDMAGWIYIEDTRIDYPVMFTPDDPEYYIHRGFDKKYASSGCLFIGANSTPDGSNVLIYGHHMKDGSMFAGIMQYADPEFAKAHPVIRYDTLTEENSYEVVAAFYTKAYASKFQYHRYTDLTEEASFNSYIRQVRRLAAYDSGAEVSFGDQLLTLSTCSYHTDYGRFVVVARRIAGEEPPPEDTPTPGK
ncbi:MAG: class B sortase [Oscillospiraceae bacterium]|nr:class B sortase [Oscillospiraceae bacterium]